MIIFPNGSETCAQVGGKAAALSRLTDQGFTVPPFFVVPAEAVAQDEPQINEALQEAARQIGPGPYAVRSSARSEDGAEASHAGQFESILNVAAAELMAAVTQVHRSGDTETVQLYRKTHGLNGQEHPAVIVQRMVPADCAGVAFSADPVRGTRGCVVISATTGLGDQLVDGSVDGENWTLWADGRVERPDAPVVLSAAQAAQIAELARNCEARSGSAQDIEWAVAEGRLYLLQSRPITTMLKAAPNPDEDLKVFDNSNIVESYPGIVSPLTYSMAQHAYARIYRAFVGLLGVTDREVAAEAALFDNMLARLDGRVYYNLGNWYRMLAMLPGFSMNQGFMETMMGVDEPLPQELIARASTRAQGKGSKLATYARLSMIALRLGWHTLVFERTKQRFLTRFETALEAERGLETAGPTELAQIYRQLEASLIDRWDAPIINDLLCMVGFGLSRKLMERWGGEDGLRLHADLLIGQGGIISAEPARRISEMGAMLRERGIVEDLQQRGVAALETAPELKERFDAYIAKFSDRCPEELKLESLTLAEDPTPLIAAICAAAASVEREASAEQPLDWKKTIRHPLRRWIARKLSYWAQARVRDRENLRFERTRIFGTVRRIFLAIGREFANRGYIEQQRDIFYLTIDEIIGSIEGNGLGSALSPIIARRKAEAEAAAQSPALPARIECRGPALSFQRLHAAPATSAEDASTQVRTGTGSSAGVLRARVRVITDPRTGRLQPGEILVARSTDPGWIALFANASGIVTERGSLLSHSAIVGRELGLPCIVGVKGVTAWLSDGDEVEIDGTKGTVRKVA